MANKILAKDQLGAFVDKLKAGREVFAPALDGDKVVWSPVNSAEGLLLDFSNQTIIWVQPAIPWLRVAHSQGPFSRHINTHGCHHYRPFKRIPAHRKQCILPRLAWGPTPAAGASNSSSLRQRRPALATASLVPCSANQQA